MEPENMVLGFGAARLALTKDQEQLLLRTFGDKDGVVDGTELLDALRGQARSPVHTEAAEPGARFRSGTAAEPKERVTWDRCGRGSGWSGRSHPHPTYASSLSCTSLW